MQPWDVVISTLAIAVAILRSLATIAQRYAAPKIAQATALATTQQASVHANLTTLVMHALFQTWRALSIVRTMQATQ